MKTEDEEALYCHSLGVALPATVTNEMMFMPGGLQTITPFAGGTGKPIRVQVDPAGAAALEAQRQARHAKGQRPYFDFEHDDKGASFWPERFFWSDAPTPGIYARGEWSSEGKAGVEGKKWRQFSPVFHVDNKHAERARIVCREVAKPNMGGLVNDPAFSKISPLWAKNAGGAPSTHTTDTPTMDPKELEALQAKNEELQKEIVRLISDQDAVKAKKETNDLIDARLEAKQAEFKANAAVIELAALKAKNKEQGDQIEAHNKTLAKASVQAAVDRGAIAAKDADTIAAWEKDITENPDRAALLAKMNGNPALGSGSRITPPASGVSVTQESPNAIMKEYGAVIAKNAAIRLDSTTAKEKGALAREAAAIFAKDISDNKTLSGMPMEDAIKAADFTDPNNNVGLLSGTLVLQKALPLMQYQYPLLNQITTDYSDTPGMFNQTEVTRIVLKPAVQTYNPAAGTDGRPLGWTTTSPAQTVDVPVKLDEYVGVPIVFGNNVLASTVRNLFGEVAPQAMYAIGGHFVDKATALMTPENFNAYQGVAASVTTTNNSAAIVVDSTAGMYPGQLISGAGIKANSFIVSVEDATHATMNYKATASATITAALGSDKVPQTYAAFVKALADFGIESLDEIASAFDLNEVPMADRFAILTSRYYRKLGSEPSVNQLFAAMQHPEIVTKRQLPELAGFQPYNAPWFPSSGDRTGFAGHKSSLILKSRLPQDFANAVGAQVPGSVTTVTDPGTGLSVLLVQYVDLRSNYAEWRPEIMLGAAVGERRAGLVLKSQ